VSAIDTYRDIKILQQSIVLKTPKDRLWWMIIRYTNHNDVNHGSGSHKA